MKKPKKGIRKRKKKKKKKVKIKITKRNNEKSKIILTT